MNIEIYKTGESNPIIISNWAEFFNYCGNPWNMSLTQFSKKYEFWNPIEKVTLDSETVFGHVLRLYRMRQEMEQMLTKEL